MRTQVEIEDLWQSYRPKSRRGGRLRRGAPRWALRGVSLEIAPGEIVGVIGNNGSGKTTLLQTVAGVLQATRGAVRTRGSVKSLVDLKTGARDLTGYETLLVHGVLLGLTRSEVRERTEDIRRFAELSEEQLAQPLYTYSTGMTLRLGFSLVVHLEPSVLLVDEVISAGDDGFHRKCMAAIHDLQQRGCGVLLVSHELPLVRDHCDRVAVLNAGQVVFEGAPDAAVEHHVARGLVLEDLPADVVEDRVAPRRQTAYASS